MATSETENTSGSSSMANGLEALTIEELRGKLEELGKSSKGSRAVLMERLRKALIRSEDKNKKSNTESGGNEDQDDESSDAESQGDGFDDRFIDQMSKLQLKEELTKRGLSRYGRSAELRERLRKAYVTHATSSESNSENDEDASFSRQRERSHKRNKRPIVRLDEVIDSLEKFSGERGENLKQWLDRFLQSAEEFEWSDLYKKIYAERLLQGAALMFMKSVKATTWGEWQKLLLEEFSDSMDSGKVHQQLASLEKKKDETYIAYVYRATEIASHAPGMEIAVIIRYIISGIKDDESHKAVLYGAKTIKELREKMKLYEELKINSINNKGLKKQPENEKTKKPGINGEKGKEKKNKKCFSCGSKEHNTQECPDKGKGRKCFKCNEFGHIAPECTKVVEEKSGDAKPKVRVDRLDQSDKKTYKDVKVLGQSVQAIIDSGSDLHVARASLYVRLGAPPLEMKKLTFSGMGSTNMSTLGRFNTEVEIDGYSFPLNIDIVPDEWMGHDFLIGGELSDLAEVNWKNRQATIKQKKSTEVEVQTDDPGWQSILSVNIQDNDQECDVSLAHIKDKEIKNKVRELVENYVPEKTVETNVKMKIILKDDIPVAQNPRRLPADQRKIINGITEDWEKRGIIRKSNSEYSSPIVPVKKKNGDVRLCVDYRMLNKKIIRDRNPLPLIEDQLDRLQDASIFSTLDLKDGFFHVPIEEESIKYTAFVTPDGQYEFLMVPFGMCISPSVFQTFVRAVFKVLIKENVVLTYLDDLIIPAMSECEAVEKLKKVLDTASKYGLIINWKKCELLVTQVNYLGYIVEKGHIRPSEDKTKAVKNFPVPNTVKKIQSFLGLTGYFRKFIPQYSLIARPLSDLLREGVKFKFGPQQELAFEQLKNALVNKPVLKLYRQEAETQLHTDACREGLGAALMQKDTEDGKFHPVYFASWKTSPTQEKYTSYELEILAVIKALEKFRVYLMGIQFKIITDCQAFVFTMKKKELNFKVARWALALEQYDYTIEHRAGTGMRHVDALSRNPVRVLYTRETGQGLIEKIKRAQSDDPKIKKIIEAEEKQSSGDFKLSPQKILYREIAGKELLVIPMDMQYEIIRTAHEQGHFASAKTEQLLRQQYWFPNMKEKVKKFVDNCIQCILGERKHGRSEGFLNPIDKGDVPLDTYHIDHLGPMPSTKKSYCHLFAVVDAFTKFVWLYPTKSTTSDEVVKRLQKQAVNFGNPRRIISDRGTAFTSKVFAQYCEQEGIEHILVTTGVPRGNGQVERINRTIIPVLTKLSIENPLEWYKHVDSLQQFLNATSNRSVGKSPFELMIGTKIKLKDDIDLRQLIEVELTEIFDENRIKIRKEAREALVKVQEENKKYFNKKRVDARIYKEGDIVAIKRTQFGPGLKVHTPFLGPYKIMKVMRNNRYTVEKIGEHEGPIKTSTAADFMKPWAQGAWPSDGLENDIDNDEDTNTDELQAEDVGIEDDAIL